MTSIRLSRKRRVYGVAALNSWLWPGAVVAINGSGNGKEMKFAGAKVELTVRTYWAALRKEE